MKLRSEFEGIRSNLMNREPVPSLDACLGELLREEQRHLTQTTMEERRSTSSPVPVAYVARGKTRGRDMRSIQCYSCKKFGQIASDCPQKFCNYCKQDGHTIKECPTRPPKKNVTAHVATIGSSSAANQNGLVAAPSVTPEMIQQMIVSAFSALGISGSTIRDDDREGV
ncbi:hypothetical protein ACHQM5_006008 [Ranunculus cassubicifolius]